LANLEERSNYKELDYFLKAENNILKLKEDDLANEATSDVFALL